MLSLYDFVSYSNIYFLFVTFTVTFADAAKETTDWYTFTIVYL